MVAHMCNALLLCCAQDVLEEPGTQLQPQPEYVHRTAVLSDVYESEQLPITLLRPGDEGHELNLTQSRSSAGGKPEWRVPRVRDPISTTAKVSASHARHRSPTSPEPGAASSEPLLDGLSHAGQSSVNAGVWRHSTHHHRSAGSSNGLNPEDEAWEAALPRGLTIDKCVGLPQSSSVLQLLEVMLSCAVGSAAVSTCTVICSLASLSSKRLCKALKQWLHRIQGGDVKRPDSD